MRRTYVASTLCALWVLLLCGCGSSTAGPGAGQPPFDLPLTQAMLHASATGTQHCDGADYDHGFCQLVSESGSAGQFAPSWFGQGLTGLAYALYHFSVAAEHTQATLTLDWQTAPEYWVALADASHERWEWHAQPAGHSLELASLAPYRVSGTGILVVIAAVGTTAGTLNAAT